jgi:endonuclease-3
MEFNHMTGLGEPAITGAEIRTLMTELEAVYGVARRLARFDPMDELVSCILSQHTSDKSSFPAFTHLRANFPEWSQVAELDLETLARAIAAAGLANQKAKAIKGCLRAIHERAGAYSLELLRTMPTLEARRWLLDLPGVGPKTASIVLCFSFGRETIPVDTHVYRVACRLGILPDNVNEAKSHDILLRIVPGDLAFRFHAALIQHGRNVCQAPIPRCLECPVSTRCLWFAEEGRKLTIARKVIRNR